MAVFNNRLWVLGGFDSSTLGDVWSSADGVNWTLETASAAWGGRYSHATVVYNNKLWVFGGADGSGLRNDVWSSADGINWTQETNAAAWSPRQGFTSVVHNNRLWVFGGDDGQMNLNNEAWSSADGISWTQLTAATVWSPRLQHATVVFNGTPIVLGGGSGGGGSMAYEADVWSMNFTAPQITSAPVTTATAGTPYIYTVAVTGAPAPALSGVTVPAWLAFDPNTGELTGTPGAADIGTTGNDVVIEATNSAGTATQSFIITVNGAPPAITSTPVLFATMGVPYTYDVIANGIPTPTMSAGTLPGWLSFNAGTGELSGTPSAGDLGLSTQIDITAANGWSPDAVQSFQIQVNGVAPVITSNAPTAVAGQLYTYSIQATGNPAPTFSVSGLPGWLNFDNVDTISGTPQQADIGMTGIITATATNSNGSDDQVFQIDVQGQPPQIISTPNQTGLAGSAYSYTVVATGIPMPTLSASGLPPWLSFNPATGEITGTPPNEGLAGPITITAANGWGTNAVQTFTIDVKSQIKRTGESEGAGCAGSTGAPTLWLLILAAGVGLAARARRRRAT
jgi:hypothetical protein